VATRDQFGQNPGGKLARGLPQFPIHRPT
jgi:hypothetical protein